MANNFMTTQVKVTKIGDSFVLPLSQEMLDKLGVQNGGEVVVSTVSDALVLRSPQAEERKKLVEKYTAEIFQEHREVLEALAEGAK